MGKGYGVRRQGRRFIKPRHGLGPAADERRRSRRLDCGGFAAALVHAAATLWRRGDAAAFQSGSDAAAVQTLRVTEAPR
jgi:hypothetical protein